MKDRQEALLTRNRLIAKIMSQYDTEADDGILPVVPLDDFFKDNWDEKSLAPNLVGYGRPSLQECYEILTSIRNRPDVQDVLISIHETPYPDEELDFDIWPDSDTVYVLTSASLGDVARWTERLKPNEISVGWTSNGRSKPLAAPKPESGFTVFALWWD